MFGRCTTPCMSDVTPQHWKHIKWIAGMLPPCASYNWSSSHKSDEGLLAQFPRDSHAKWSQQLTWKKKNVCLGSVLEGLGTPSPYTKKCSVKGLVPPWFSDIFFVGYDPPKRIGLPQGDIAFLEANTPKLERNVSVKFLVQRLARWMALSYAASVAASCLQFVSHMFVCPWCLCILK